VSKVYFAGRRISIPGSPALRLVLGVVMVVFGLLGFLPVLGFWMIPLGLAILAVDLPWVRRLYRRLTVSVGAFLHRRWPGAARLFGYGRRRPGRSG